LCHKKFPKKFLVVDIAVMCHLINHEYYIYWKEKKNLTRLRFPLIHSNFPYFLYTYLHIQLHIYTCFVEGVHPQTSKLGPILATLILKKWVSLLLSKTLIILGICCNYILWVRLTHFGVFQNLHPKIDALNLISKAYVTRNKRVGGQNSKGTG